MGVKTAHRDDLGVACPIPHPHFPHPVAGSAGLSRISTSCARAVPPFGPWDDRAAASRSVAARWRSWYLSYGARRHAAKAQTCRVGDGLGDEGWGSPPDQRRRGRKPSRGVAFQLLERRTSRPDDETVNELRF